MSEQSISPVPIRIVPEPTLEETLVAGRLAAVGLASVSRTQQRWEDELADE